MKKFTLALLTGLFFFIFCSGYAVAENVRIKLRPSKQRIQAGQKFQFDVYVKTKTTIGAYDFAINYPSNMIKITEIVSGDGTEKAKEGVMASVNTEKKGTAFVNGFDVNGFSPGKKKFHLLTIKGYALDTKRKGSKKAKANITVNARALYDVLVNKLTFKKAKKAKIVIVP